MAQRDTRQSAETGAHGTPPMVMVTSGIESSLEQSTVDSPSGDGSSVHACQRRATGDGMHGREWQYPSAVEVVVVAAAAHLFNDALDLMDGRVGLCCLDRSLGRRLAPEALDRTAAVAAQAEAVADLLRSQFVKNLHNHGTRTGT